MPTHTEKNFSLNLNDELGRREYDALAGAFRALDSQQTEKRFHKLTMEAGWEWIVTLDALRKRSNSECSMSPAYNIKSPSMLTAHSDDRDHLFRRKATTYSD